VAGQHLTPKRKQLTVGARGQVEGRCRDDARLRLGVMLPKAFREDGHRAGFPHPMADDGNVRRVRDGGRDAVVVNQVLGRPLAPMVAILLVGEMVDLALRIVGPQRGLGLAACNLGVEAVDTRLVMVDDDEGVAFRRGRRGFERLGRIGR
jgi:hypothetical protein